MTAGHNESIEQLDLEPIMVKIMDKEEGLGWSMQFTQQVSEEYKRYLTLCLENPDFPVVPSKFVDEFWHFHILDTQKYQEDCQSIFGYFLHHFPYFGMRNENDAKNLTQAWTESCSLYEKRFRKINKTLWPSSARCPNCGKKCKNVHPFLNEERPRLKLVVQ